MGETTGTGTEEEYRQLSRIREANWPMVLFLIHVHFLSLYGVWLLLIEVKWMTVLLLITLSSFAILGVTTGAHRLWAHRTYKASSGLRVFLAVCQTLAGQGSIYDWVQYHRLHHAHFGTDGDPYNHNKGFIYAHLLTRLRCLSPYQERLLKDIDMSDLESDQIVMMQKKFYWLLYGVMFMLLPVNAPLEYWDDSILSVVFVIIFLRYLIVVHATWLVESGICLWGLQLGQRITETETSYHNSVHHTERESQSCELKKRKNKYEFYINNKESYGRQSSVNEWKWMSKIREWERDMGFETPLRWTTAIIITALHVVTVGWFLYYCYLGITPKWQTFVFTLLMGDIAGFGVTGGAHRYWCHRSYKAKLPLQIILMCCFAAAGQNTIYEWVRDHRVHHKYSETSADPHDARRGFFFSHVGWLMMKKHQEVIRKGVKIDMSDIVNDPLVQFHTRYFMILKMAFCFLLPSMIPALWWNERWDYAILSQSFVRYVASLNFTWSVNSFAHLWGDKPYDRHIMPVENWGVSIVAMGEGWHNYHHTFPWDYKAAELSYTLNLTTFLLDMFAKIGWAYDMKKASPCLIKAVALRRGEIKYAK